MAKKQEPAAAPEAEVAFDFSAGEIRTAEIKAPGYKPFSITFRVPGVAGRSDLLMADYGGESDADRQSRGQAAVRFCADHLVSWTLPQPVGYKSLDAMRSPLVLWSIFSAIRKSESAAKN